MRALTGPVRGHIWSSNITVRMLTDDRRYSEVWWCSSSFKIFIYIQNRFKTGPSLCFPRIYMFLSASPRETLRFSRNRMNCFPRACKLWVDLSCFNHVKERKRRFQTGRNLPYTYQAMRCALAHKCNQYSKGEPEPHSTSSTDTTDSPLIWLSLFQHD